MTFLRRPGFRAVLPVAITTAVCGTLLVAPSAGAAPVPMQVLSDDVIAGPSRADSRSESTDRFIVTFEEGVAGAPGAKAHVYGRVAKKLGISVRELRETVGGAVVVEAAAGVSAESADSVVALLNAHPDVEHAEEDVLLRPLATVDDPLYAQQWNLHEETAGLRVPGAWDRATGAGEIIAILDTGITAHSDLAFNVLPGYDFVTDLAISVDGNGRDSDPSDPGDACLDPEAGTQASSSWHGTHVSGIAAADGDNGRGVVGVAYGANLQPLRVMGACGGYLSDTIAALVWAAGGAVEGVPVNYSPARIINMSLGSEGLCTPSLQAAIDFAVNQGSVVVAAAGNEAQPVANVLPANCNNVITVGATDRAGNSASYSNYGPGVDVSAPGGESPYGIGSTYNTGQTTPDSEAYATMQGTSMAAPHVAGVAALMLSANPDLNPAQVEQILRESARPLPGTCAGGCGTGIVDANAAVALAGGVPFSPSIRSTADVIAADSAGTLWNYPSNGKGGLLPRVKIGSGWSSLKSGMVTDWNSDGVLDLIGQWKDGRLTFSPGIPQGGFKPPVKIGNGWSSYHMTVGRWRSGDRFPGVVAYDAYGSLWHYPNNTGGVVRERTRISGGWKGFYLTMMDYDGDSRQDIVAKRSDGKLLLYRSNGQGAHISEPRKLLGNGWHVVNSVGAVSGFQGLGSAGLVARLTDGRLAYYPVVNARWGTRLILSGGWGPYNIFR